MVVRGVLVRGPGGHGKKELPVCLFAKHLAEEDDLAPTQARNAYHRRRGLYLVGANAAQHRHIPHTYTYIYLPYLYLTPCITVRIRQETW